VARRRKAPSSSQHSTLYSTVARTSPVDLTPFATAAAGSSELSVTVKSSFFTPLPEGV